MGVATKKVDGIRLEYMKGCSEAFRRGRDKEVVWEQDGVTWSLRTAKLRLADGTEHDGIVQICETDSGEHYGTGIWVDDGVTWQDDADFLERLGRTKEQVFPYKYNYFGYVPCDHHVRDDGWSI